MKKFIKSFFVLTAILSAFLLSAIVYFDKNLSDSYCIVTGENLVFSNSNFLSANGKNKTISVQKNGAETVGGYYTTVKIMGVIPVKTVHVTVADETDVVVLGTPFGIKIYTDGVLVVGFCDVDTKDGGMNPAAAAGLRVGDSILKINQTEVSSNSEVQNIISSSNGDELTLTVKRSNKTFEVAVTPVMSESEKRYKTGLWIRDSSAGIGTLTFYSPALKVTAGLGHGICDADTGELLPLKSGEFLEAEIIGVKKSGANVTGELQGVFSGGAFSRFANNDITGVYGCDCADITGGTIYPVAMKQEIVAGNATIITTVDGQGPKEYECVIEKVYHNDDSKIKNMVIKVTDPELLSITGGIVQGMSGSPIIQNGKLIGAVTHVFVNDCTKGYAIFAENMLDTAKSIPNSR